MNNPPLISGEWRHAYEHMLAFFDSLNVEGECGLIFRRDVGLGDLFLFMISSAGETLNLSVTSWKKQYDAYRWRTETAFAPTLITETLSLPDEITNFASFFDALVLESEEKLLLKKGVVILDGEQFRLSLFRNGERVRLLSWDSATDAIGLMKRIIDLSAGKDFNS